MAKPVVDPLDIVMRRGRRVHRPGFSVYWLPLTVPLAPRIVVGQKVDKRATVRNLIRRRIRSVLSQAHLRGVGLVVVGRKPILELTFQQLKADLGRILQQIK